MNLIRIERKVSTLVKLGLLLPPLLSIAIIRWNPSRSSTDVGALDAPANTGLLCPLSTFGRLLELRTADCGVDESCTNNCRKRDDRPVVGTLSKNTDDVGAVLAVSSKEGASSAKRLSTSTIFDFSAFACSSTSVIVRVRKYQLRIHFEDQYHSVYHQLHPT